MMFGHSININLKLLAAASSGIEKDSSPQSQKNIGLKSPRRSTRESLSPLSNIRLMLVGILIICAHVGSCIHFRPGCHGNAR